MLVLLLILLLPAGFAWFARTTSGAICSALFPGAFSLFSLFRLWQMSHENSGGCGLGAGIAVLCALFCGISAAVAAIVVLVRLRMAPPASLADASEVGFSPEAV